MSTLDDRVKDRGVVAKPDAPKVYLDVIQGTSEWLRLRSGVPTSSEFDKIVTPSGGKSKSANLYMCRLLVERITGHPCQEFMSQWMQRGTQLEVDAVEFYEFTRDVKTFKIGFITNHGGTVGASPDRGVAEDGLVEIKVPNHETHMAYLLGIGDVSANHKAHAQGQVWAAGKELNDLLG